MLSVEQILNGFLQVTVQVSELLQCECTEQLCDISIGNVLL